MTPSPSSDRDPNQSRQHSRRTALSTITAAGAASLSGCLGILGGDNTSTPDDDTTGGSSTLTATSGPSLPDYTKWTYPMGTRDTKAPYEIKRYDPQTIINNEESLAAGVRDSMDWDMVDLGVYLDGLAEPEDVESLLVFNSNRIYKGPWSAAELQESVEAFLNVEAAGEHGEYNLYENTKTGDCLAVTDNWFIAGRIPDDVGNEMESPVEVVKLIIDTYAGEATRYGEANTDFELLLDGTEAGYFNRVLFRPGPAPETRYDFARVEGKLAEHITLQLDGDATAVAFRLLFDSAESASMDVAKEFSEEVPWLAGWSDKSITQRNDRLFTITGTTQAE